MNHKQRFYPEARFGGFTDIDGTVAFYARVNALASPSSVVLDVGCGRAAHREDPIPFRRQLRILRGKVARVIGIDVDPGAGENPYLDEFHLIRGDFWPVEDASIDLVLCDYVLEHIPDPDHFFAEMRRVLKNDGHLCIRTTNRWSYVGVAASVIPNRFHARVTAVVQDNRREEDVFSICYRCNSVGRLNKTMKIFDFDGVAYGYEAEPSYLSFSVLAYFAGVLHQRFSPAFMKPAIFAFAKARKRGEL